MKTQKHGRPLSPASPPESAPPPSSENGQATANIPVSAGHEHIPPQWAWHHRTLLRLRDRLMRARFFHAQEATMPLETRGVDAAEAAREQREHELLWTELAKEEDQLFEIDCALQRIRDGVYGLCEETGHTIPPERLLAIPWTRYCRIAAERRERKRG